MFSTLSLPDSGGLFIRKRHSNETLLVTNQLFYRFKVGMAGLVFPLALGIYKALRERGLLDFDCIVPTPLSPDKAAAGEINRTALLANELARLLGTRVADVLQLMSAPRAPRCRARVSDFTN
jgi:predicted amidophosphoribosyltransferase